MRFLFLHSVYALALVLHYGNGAADLRRPHRNVLQLRGGGDRRMDARENYPMPMRQQGSNAGQFAGMYGNDVPWQRRDPTWSQGGMQQPMNQAPMNNMWEHPKLAVNDDFAGAPSSRMNRGR
eukprot:758169-Hanusia_phi.AAC.4